jgi:hypothetical protein
MTDQYQNQIGNDPLQAMWEEAGQASNGLPQPGIYTAQLVKATFRKKSSNGHSQIEVLYAIEGGGEVRTYFVLKNAKALYYLKQWVKILGYQFPHHHTQLGGILAEVCASRPWCEIEAIDNSGFIYARLLRRLDPLPEPQQTQPMVPAPVQPQLVAAAPAAPAMPATPPQQQGAQIVPMNGAVGQAITVAHTTV